MSLDGDSQALSVLFFLLAAKRDTSREDGGALGFFSTKAIADTSTFPPALLLSVR